MEQLYYVINILGTDNHKNPLHIMAEYIFCSMTIRAQKKIINEFRYKYSKHIT